MRVLRTVTSENSAATKKPLANTSARMTAMPKARWDVSIIAAPWRTLSGGAGCGKRPPSRHRRPAARLGGPAATARLGATVAEEVRVDEGVDGGLIGRFDLFELQAHADAPVAPRDARLDLDFTGCGREPEPHAGRGARIERAGGPDGDPAAREIQRERRRDCVAEAISDRDAEDDPRAPTPVEAVREEVRRQRRHDVLHRAVLVDVSDHAQPRQLAHFLGRRNRTAEDENAEAPLVDLPDRAHEIDARRVREPEVERDEVDAIEIGAHACQQLHGTAYDNRPVPGFFERRLEAVAHEARVVGDHDRLGRYRTSRHLVKVSEACTKSGSGRVARRSQVSL